ncbi:MAG TPA: 2-oxoglutarate dehydrogenase complex dihydrolipoyllysine-residue succinyltransferase [Anaerolineales bacterium]|nr:2-oxoglutarate dehydrogenase complex dihydrolipoyllysine-residue succinyltransferase [Anaerolineales bacterium]
MANEVTVPEMGESVLEATVGHWLKQEGDYVNVGDVLVELETDKVNVEVGAKSAGVLQQIKVPEGGDVKVGDVLGMIEQKAEQPQAAGQQTPAPQAKLEQPAPAQPPTAEEVQKESQPVQEEKVAAEETAPRIDGDGPGTRQKEVPLATPVASRLARDKEVDLTSIRGTGSEGRVTKSDVEQYLQTRSTPKQAEEQQVPLADVQNEVSAKPPAGSRLEERIRMSRRRRTIAQRLLEAKNSTAMLTTFNEVDMTNVMSLRKRTHEQFVARHGIKLGIVSFFVKATVAALKDFPNLNAEIQGDEFLLKHYYDIGMAIGAEEGLVVPVIRDADKLSFADIEKYVKELVVKSQSGKLSIEDLRGGTFTITNGGVFGSLMSTPILNPPQVGILGLHKIEDRPIALNGQVVIRPMMYTALSYDHRIVDGREAVQFLVRVKEFIEDPALFLLEG